MKRIGIITALLREGSCLPVQSPQPAQPSNIDALTTLFICGMGADRAGKAAQRLLAAGCEGLISWGTSAGLADDIRPGDLIIPEKIVARGDHFNTDDGWRTAVIKQLSDCPGALHLGVLADSPDVMTSREEKRSLRQRSKAHAADMESAAIAAVAAQHHVPFIAIRAIADSSTMSVPEMVLEFSGPFGEVRVLKMMAALLKNARQIPALIKLGTGFKAASGTLTWIGHRHGQILRPG